MLEDHGYGGFRPDLELRSPDGYPVLPDLADPVLRISIHYDGTHHDQQGQRERDVRRQRATAQNGWTEIRLTARDLVEQELLAGLPEDELQLCTKVLEQLDRRIATIRPG